MSNELAAKSTDDTDSTNESANTTTAAGQGKEAQSTTGNGKPQSQGKTDKKDYTTDLPMWNLEQMIEFVSEIHSKGLENAKMPEVAEAFGYKAPSSTSFYRKLVASRLFGLMGSNSPELSSRARDYIEPTLEDAKPKALVDAVQGIPYYAEVLSKYVGKRLNVELVGNDIARTYNLTHGCSKSCAKTFEASARFAGLISPENMVLASAAKPSSENQEEGKDKVKEDEDTQKHTLYLDKQKRRKFHMVTPLTVSQAELERIKSWIGFTIIVEDAAD